MVKNYFKETLEKRYLASLCHMKHADTPMPHSLSHRFVGVIFEAAMTLLTFFFLLGEAVVQADTDSLSLFVSPCLSLSFSALPPHCRELGNDSHLVRPKILL